MGKGSFQCTGVLDDPDLLRSQKVGAGAILKENTTSKEGRVGEPK